MNSLVDFSVLGTIVAQSGRPLCEHKLPVKNSSLAVALAALLLTPYSSALAQWSSDPMVNLAVAPKPEMQVQPKVRPALDGGCYISWFDDNPKGHPPFGYDVYMQRLDASGVAQWVAGGIRFADLGMSSTQDYGLDVDASGNALLTFLDDRNRHGISVTIMMVDPTGAQLWGNGGIMVGKGTQFLGNPKITATSDGFAVAGWINGNNLTLQRMDAAGNRQWGPAGITITAPAGLTYSMADLHAGDNGSVIVSFVSAAGFSGPKYLLADKLSSTGAVVWAATVFDGGSLQFGNFPPFVTDGSGGAVFGWYEVSPLQSRAQHILADGSEAFPHNGTPGSTNTADNQVNPSVSYDPATGFTYLFWDEQLPGPLTNEGISAQKFNATGVVQWGPTGIVVQPFTSSAVINVTSVFTAAGPSVVWSSEPAYAQDTIVGAKLNASGTLVCPPFAVSSFVSSKSRLDLTLSSNGVTFAAWSDGRTANGNPNIYAQDIKADCTLGQ
jgi:hypothetical protein